MSIKTNELQQLAPLTGAERLLADSPGAGTGLIPFNAAAQFFGGELVKPGNAVGAALGNKAAVDFSNLPNPQAALYNLGARPRDNILHNSRWDRLENIINQRGQTEYTATGYTIDRWKVEDSNNKMICSIVDSGIKLELPADAAVQAFWTQYIESPSADFLTASLLLEDARGDIRLYLGSHGKHKIQSRGIYSVSGTLTESKPYFRVVLQPGSSCIIQAAKLELGPVQTLARQNAEGTWELTDPPPDPALELAKCQRYLQVLLYGGYDEAYLGIGGISIADNKPKISIPFQLKQPMRANQTLITGYMQVNKARIVGRSLSTYLPDWGAAVESMSVYTSTKNQILVACKLPDTVTLAANYTYELDALSCQRGEVLLASAEL